MLRDDVVAAVEAGLFHVFAINTVDEGMEVLTGIPAGAQDESGRFAEGSLNARVELRLLSLAVMARVFRSAPKDARPAPADLARTGDSSVSPRRSRRRP